MLPDGSIDEAFNLGKWLDGSYGVVFFWLLDFTFVCPSETLGYNARVGALAERGAKLVGVSIDSQFAHHAWRETPVERGGPGAVDFPLVANVTKSISRDYGVLTGGAVALRGTFVIDRDGVVRQQIVNDLPLGRDADEAVRILDALQFHEEHGEVCPAGWRKVSASMKPDAAGVAAYLRDHAHAL